MASGEWQVASGERRSAGLVCGSSSDAARYGYTLIELLLVVGLLVIAAAIVAPSVMQGGDRAQVRDAADKLAAMWGRARLDAVASGDTLLFQCELGGSLAKVQNPAGAMGVAVEDGAAAEPLHQLEMQNVVLRSLSIAEPAGSEAIVYAESAAGVAPAVVFRPDGAASDAEALLEHTSGLQLKVVLRGMTGAVRVEEIAAE